MSRCVSTINALPSNLRYGAVRARAIRYGGFAIEAELPCINGLSAWFTIAHVSAIDDSELLMTEGAIGCAKDIAGAIVATLSASSALENGPAGLADAHSKSPAPSSQSERIAVLEAVLGPFASGCDIFFSEDPDDRVVSMGRWHGYREDGTARFYADVRLTVADIRRARSALAPLGDE